MPRSLAPITLLALTLLVPIPACGGDDEGGGDAEVGDGDGDPSTGDGDPSTGDGDGDPSTGDGDGDPSTGDGDGDGDPPFMDTSTYSAVLMPGPPDRVAIRRVNNDEPSCTYMVLVKPGFDSFDIQIFEGYAIEEARVWRQGFCPMDLANPDGEPTTGTGTITVGSYDALMTFPCTLNFDLEINNATDPPSMSTWKKTGVPVDGVNCG